MAQVGAVVAAAGMSSRMGGFKPLMNVGAMTMVERICANFRRVGVDPVVLVTGFMGDELAARMAKTGVIRVHNPGYETTQMFDSAKLGFDYIQGKCDRVFFTPVDIPLFTADTVKRLAEAQGGWVKPTCGGRDGHPILIDAAFLPRLLAASADNLRDALWSVCGEAETVEVSDEGVLLDADTPEEFDALVALHNRQLLRPLVTVSLMGERKLFDTEAAMLMKAISYDGTVKGACERIGLSYSKAWQVLSALEEHLGFPLIERKPGGASGGGSELSERGAALLAAYERLAADTQRYAESRFPVIFKGVFPL